jgi:hypothetical protein
MNIVFTNITTSAGKAKRKIPAAQLKKMQQGLKKYRAEMDKLRDKAAKKAKITPAQYKKYLAAMRSPECIAEGRLAGVKAAEIAKISDAKYKAFTKAYRELRAEYKDKKSESKSSVMEAGLETQLRLSLKKVYSAIQFMRKKFSAAKSDGERDDLRNKLKSFKQYYNKLYSKLNGTPYYAVANSKMFAEDAEVSSETEELLNKQYDLSSLLNLVQSDKFYDWYAGPFSSWLAEEEGAPSDDEIVKWAAKSLEESE